jgi:DNA-binding transcriptional LysR family regulator
MLQSNSNWNLYRNFLVVYETKNLHRAAEILGLTRSTVGSNIKELGNQIGVTLFTSSRKGVEPTSEAITLYPSIRKAVDLITDGEGNVQEFTPETRAVIRLSVPSTFASTILQDYFKEFCNKYPLVRFEFSSHPSFDLLAQKKIDLVIGVDYHFAALSFRTVPLCTLHGVLVASKDFLNKCNIGTTISKSELAKLPIAAHKMLADFPAALGLPNELYMTTTSNEFSYAMAKNSVAAAFCHFETVNKINAPNMVCLEIEGATMPTINFVCGFNDRGLTKPAKVFLDGLINFCKKLRL